MKPTPPPRPVVMRRRAQLILIAALFLGPLALSFWAYYGVRLRPAGHTNQGELVTPARPLPDAILAMRTGSTTTAELLRGRWTLVYVARGDCDGDCRRALEVARSVVQALGSDAPRAHRVLLIDAPCCGASTPERSAELGVAWLAGEEGARLAQALRLANGARFPPGRTYLVDPLGNLMMTYPAGTAEPPMLRDLEHLLKLSHIG